MGSEHLFRQGPPSATWPHLKRLFWSVSLMEARFPGRLLLALMALLMAAEVHAMDCYQAFEEGGFQLATISDDLIGALVNEACLKNDWFRKLYRQQPKAYRVWAKKEQERLLLIDVLARPTTLGHCLQKYLDDNKLDDLSGQFYFLTRVEALRGSTDEPRQQQLEACAIYEHFFNPNSDSYKELVLDQDERNRVQRYLSSICDEGSKGEYDPKTRIFDAAFRTIHGAIEAAQPPVLPEFFGSKSFQACHGGRRSVRRDLTSFGRLRNEYCQTEANAADERLGESDGRYKLMSALLQTWKELCEQDPLFWPKFLPVPPMQPSGLDESALQQQ